MLRLGEDEVSARLLKIPAMMTMISKPRVAQGETAVVVVELESNLIQKRSNDDRYWKCGC